MTGWDRMDAAWWPTVADALPKPWPRDAVLFDLRWWDGQERIYRATKGRKGAKRPGRPTLCERWGLKQKRARLIMASVEEWQDPHHEDMRAEGPTKGQPRASEGPAKGQYSAREAAPALTAGASEGPAKGQEGANEGPHGRSFTGHEARGTEHPSSSPKGSGGSDGLTALWARIQDRRAVHQPRAKGQALTKARRKNLAARLKELHEAGFTADDLVNAVDWVHTSSSSNAEGARKGSPVTTLLRPSHCVEYVELAIAECGPPVDNSRPVEVITDPAVWVADRFAGLLEGWQRATAEDPQNPHGPFDRMLRQRVDKPRDVAAAFRRARTEHERQQRTGRAS